MEFKHTATNCDTGCQCRREPALYRLELSGFCDEDEVTCPECNHTITDSHDTTLTLFLGRHCLANLIETALDDHEVRRELELRRVLPQGVPS